MVNRRRFGPARLGLQGMANTRFVPRLDVPKVENVNFVMLFAFFLGDSFRMNHSPEAMINYDEAQMKFHSHFWSVHGK
jgi:hypothetical protein